MKKPTKIELKCSQFVTIGKTYIEPGIMNQSGEVVATMNFYSSLSKTPNTPIAIIPFELPDQDCPIRSVTITFNY